MYECSNCLSHIICSMQILFERKGGISEACLGSGLLKVGQQVPHIHERVQSLQACCECWERALAGGCEEHQLCGCCKQGNLLACIADDSIYEVLVGLFTSSSIALQ